MTRLYSISPRCWNFAGSLIAFVITLFGMWVATRSIYNGNAMATGKWILATIVSATVGLILFTVAFAAWVAFTDRRK